MNIPKLPTLSVQKNSTPGPTLQDLIEESVERFSIELGAMSGIARMNGWFEKYRSEIERVAQESYRRGMLQSANAAKFQTVENPVESANQK